MLHKLEQPLPQSVHHHVVLCVQFSRTPDQTTQQRVNPTWGGQKGWNRRPTEPHASVTTPVTSQLTLKDDPPGGKEGLEQGDAGEPRVFPVVGIQTSQRRLNGQVGEAVGRCGKDVGDAGVNVGVVSRVTAELSAHCFGSHDVGQVIPEHKDLREDRGFTSLLPWRRVDCRVSAIYLRVGTHDLARFLVESLAVPLGVESLQITSQTIVLAQKQRVKRCQGDVFVHTDVTWQEETLTLQLLPSTVSQITSADHTVRG